MPKTNKFYFNCTFKVIFCFWGILIIKESTDWLNLLKVNNPPCVYVKICIKIPFYTQVKRSNCRPSMLIVHQNGTVTAYSFIQSHNSFAWCIMHINRERESESKQVGYCVFKLIVDWHIAHRTLLASFSGGIWWLFLPCLSTGLPFCLLAWLLSKLSFCTVSVSSLVYLVCNYQPVMYGCLRDIKKPVARSTMNLLIIISFKDYHTLSDEICLMETVQSY